MLTFLDEKDVEYGVQAAYTVTTSVNGERSVKGTVYTNDHVLKSIDRGWRFRLEDEYYRVTYAKPLDTGRRIEIEFDAVHQFFYDMSKSIYYGTLDGSNPLKNYLEAIFQGSGYRYNLEVELGSLRKENFGNKSRLALFNDIIKATKLEFSVTGKVVRLVKNVGTDKSAIVRKNFNMSELKIEKDINNFITYQKGLGAWKDEEDHAKGRYESAYESPLAKVYGRIEGEPVVDERYKETGKLLERLKENVDNSYRVSVEIDMADLTKAGYDLPTPVAGDYLMAINETLGFKERVRIVSVATEYDVAGNVVNRKVICNDIGSVQRNTSEMNNLSKSVSGSLEESARAVEIATQALTSADGKNTNYFGDSKPRDVPKGTLKKGDRLFLTVGDKTELYFWNGAEWELEPTSFDLDKFNTEFDKKSAEIKSSAAEATKKATEALEKAGGIVDSQELLDKINTRVALATGDLEDKVADNRRNIIRRTYEVKREVTTYQQTNDAAIARITQDLGNTVSKAEIKQTVDGIREEISSITVGARNLMDGTQDFSGDWFDRQYWTLESEKYLGLSVYSRQDLWRGMSRTTEVRLGETYTFSAFIKSSVDNDLVFMYLDNRLVEPRAALSVTRKDIRVGTNWTRVSATFKVTKAGMMTPRFERNNKNAKLFIAGFKLELGSVQSDWSPSINDTNQTITDRLTTFDRTLDGLRATVAQSKSYVDEDGKRQEQINQLIDTKTATAIGTLQSEIGKGYVKAIDHTRDLTTLRDDLTLKINQAGTETDGKIDSKLATYSRTIDGRFTQLSSVYAPKTDLDQAKKDLAATRTEVQSITETTKLYDRLIGSTEDKIKQNIARMTMTDSLFQTEVTKIIKEQQYTVDNYIKDPFEFSQAIATNRMTIKVNGKDAKGFGRLTVNYSENARDTDLLELPISELPAGGNVVSFYISTLGQPVPELKVGLKVGLSYSWFDDIKRISQGYSGTQSIRSFFLKSSGGSLVIATPGRRVYTIQKPILVVGKEPVTDYSISRLDEATQSIKSQIAGAWAIKNLNSYGDLISGISLGADGNNRISGKATHITGETLIDNAVIKSAMIADISADKITSGRIDASKVNVVNMDAKNITTGTLKGVDIQGAIFSSLDGGYQLNSRTKEIYFGDNSLLSFYSAKNRQYAFIGSGDRPVNGSGHGIVLMADVDDSAVNDLRTKLTGRDLWTYSSRSSASLMVGAVKNLKGAVVASATTGIELSVKRGKSGNQRARIEIGSLIGDARNAGAISLHGESVSATTEGELYLAGGSMRILKGGKDFIQQYNALARFVVQIANQAGWKNVGDYTF